MFFLLESLREKSDGLKVLVKPMCSFARKIEGARIVGVLPSDFVSKSLFCLVVLCPSVGAGQEEGYFEIFGSSIQQMLKLRHSLVVALKEYEHFHQIAARRCVFANLQSFCEALFRKYKFTHVLGAHAVVMEDIEHLFCVVLLIGFRFRFGSSKEVFEESHLVLCLFVLLSNKSCQ